MRHYAWRHTLTTSSERYRHNYLGDHAWSTKCCWGMVIKAVHFWFIEPIGVLAQAAHQNPLKRVVFFQLHTHCAWYLRSQACQNACTLHLHTHRVLQNVCASGECDGLLWDCSQLSLCGWYWSLKDQCLLCRRRSSAATHPCSEELWK